MSEDNKLATEAEMNAVEAEIKAKQAEEFKKLSDQQAKEIENKVRNEFQEKSERDALQAKLKEQEEALKKAQLETEAKMKAQQEAFEKRLQELEATKKGVIKNESPFDSKDKPINPTHQRILPDGKIIDTSDPKVMDEIQEASRREWMKKVGIQNEDWGIPREKNIR